MNPDDVFARHDEMRRRSDDERNSKRKSEDDERSQRRQYHGDKYIAQRAEADKLFHQVAMAGIGLEMTLISAFKVHGVVSMILHTLCIAAFLCVIPLYRKLLDFRVKALLRASRDLLGEEPPADADFYRHSWWYEKVFYSALILLLLSALWSIWTSGNMAPMERLSDPL